MLVGEDSSGGSRLGCVLCRSKRIEQRFPGALSSGDPVTGS